MSLFNALMIKKEPKQTLVQYKQCLACISKYDFNLLHRKPIFRLDQLTLSRNVKLKDWTYSKDILQIF